MNHADPEAVGFGGAAAAAAAESAAATEAARVRDLPVAQTQGLRPIAREPDVAVRAAQALRFRQRERGPLAVARIADRRNRILTRVDGAGEGPARHAGDHGAGPEHLQKVSSVSTAHW